ncbi:hypothetical protein MAQ5080_02631 [Marinomonas aquimarina]|uniref:Uncharacterized protein n=1 Tax=Marinomonas aquimarina TaxID=295068 RepID=A0A1A8TKX4_9GAMM|nr:hypothetical protein [Marinomonas aquimarina]SBS33631.1 hypothetical protein MAQ5080_02631 [Marinomonas aquimarina]
MKWNYKIAAITVYFFCVGSVGAQDIDQANLCVTKSWKAADNSTLCKVGQKVAFLPNSFGNEQLPVMFAALNCDLKYGIALTNGGATCIFKPVEKVIE